MQAVKTKIRSWGNSQGIRIPREIMEIMEFKTNDELNIEIREEGLLLSKTPVRKSLEEYAASYGGLGPYREFDWGENIGFSRWIDEQD